MDNYSLFKAYSQEIEDFFEGRLSSKLFENTDDSEYYSGHSKTKGHVWISTHKTFETLTVEPPEGGQYEIAVRMRNEESDDDMYSYPGYSISEGTWFHSYGTGGH